MKKDARLHFSSFLLLDVYIVADDTIYIYEKETSLRQFLFPMVNALPGKCLIT
jgi:hypothetical protein